MLASASGPLGALLMIAPLAAIPVFAVVGVPHFAPVAASPADDEEISEITDTHPANATPARPTPRRSADDLFAPVKVPGESRESDRRGAYGAATDRPIPLERRGKSRMGGVSPILPPEALDDWEVATNVPGDSNGRDSGQARGRRNEGAPDLPPVDDGLSHSKGTAAPQAEPFDDSPPPSVSKKVKDRKTADSRSDGSKPRDFDPGLIHPDANSSPKKLQKNIDMETQASARGNRALQAQQGRATPERMPPGQQHPAMSGAPEQSGWQTAARRLKELGIRKYRLESQIEEQMFLFRCEYPTPETPQVTELFEAVADTPLDAVLEALRQIDEWLQSEDRTAESLGQ